MWFAQSAHTGFARSPNVTPTLISSPDVPEDAEALDADDELEPAAGVEVADADFSDVDFAVDAALSPEPHPMRPQAIAPANVNATHFEMFFFIPSLNYLNYTKASTLKKGDKPTIKWKK